MATRFLGPCAARARSNDLEPRREAVRRPTGIRWISGRTAPRLPLLLLAAPLALAGCVSVVAVPPPTPDDVEVLLVDEAWHKGLVLPSADGGPVEWGFGDFAWYALEENAWYDVFATVLWPSAGTLSRRAWPPEERARRAAGDVHGFRASRARVERLAGELEAAFERERASYHWNEHYQTAFVRSEDDYWMFHDCHDATADWLRALGCDVEGAIVRTGIALQESDGPRD